MPVPMPSQNFKKGGLAGINTTASENDAGGFMRSNVTVNATKDETVVNANIVELVLENPAAEELENHTGATLDSVELEAGMTASKEIGLGKHKDHPAIPTAKEIKGSASIRKRAKGIVWMLIAILSASAQSTITKSCKDIPTGEFIMITGTYSTLFFCIIVAFLGVSLTEFPLRKLVFIRVMFSVVVKIVLIWSFQNLPLGDATALIFTSPLFACIFGRIFLKEKLTLPHLIALILGIIGIVLIAKPTFYFLEKRKRQDLGTITQCQLLGL